MAIDDARLKKKIDELIESLLTAKTLRDISHVKKLQGLDIHWSMRLGSYRIGLIQEEDTLILARVLHRREFYRYFP